MTAPQPGNPPDPALLTVSAWAQPAELPVDVQGLHTYDTWCAVLGLASDILWAASGRKWRNVQSTETVTLDPPEGCGRAWIPSYAVSAWGYGQVMLTADAGCGLPTRVRLPRPDVTAITAVSVGGSPFAAYRLRNSWAIRTDGLGWPMNTSTRISYTFGRLRPEGGRLTAILMATELGRFMAGRSCQLPARVTSVTRQAVSFEVLESLEYLEKGLTGIPSVDSWIRASNPNRLTTSGSVWSPDIVVARDV